MKVKIPQYNTAVKIKSRANVNEIAASIADVIRQESKKPYVQDLARSLCINKEQPYYTAVQLCNFAYQVATFYPDEPGVQVIKTPAALMRERKGNCVDYSVFIGAIATAADVPVTLKIVAIEPSENYGHIYPYVNGLPCDVVPYQMQDGTEPENRRLNGSVIVWPLEKNYKKAFTVKI